MWCGSYVHFDEELRRKCILNPPLQNMHNLMLCLMPVFLCGQLRPLFVCTIMPLKVLMCRWHTLQVS